MVCSFQKRFTAAMINLEIVFLNIHLCRCGMDPTDVVRRKLMLGLKGLSGTQMLQGVNTTVKLCSA